MNKVFVACPSYDGKIPLEFVETLADTEKHGASVIKHMGGSVLTYNFNMLYAEALNTPDLTHFCMIHADVLPENGWLGVMLEEMKRVDADILSAVITLKNGKGLTSTVLDDGTFAPAKLSLKDALDLAETFTADNLLLNTGLMLIDLRKDWTKRVWFSNNDEILYRDGKFIAICEGEDYVFSKKAKALGAKLYATTKVKVDHVGTYKYTNRIKAG